MVKDFELITKEEFEAYEEVRQSGVVNMFSPQVQELADIDKATHAGIIEHYEKLMQKCPEVRS